VASTDVATEISVPGANRSLGQISVGVYFWPSVESGSRMLRDCVELPLAVRVVCLVSLINLAGSFVVIFLTIYASEQLGFGVPFGHFSVIAIEF
jgi:hypothetical protein